MRWQTGCVAFVLLASGATPVSAADEFPAQRKVMTAFLKAFANADTKGMLTCYSSDVIVVRGSTLLHPKYGGLGTSKARNKDVTVTKEKLAIAYEKTIENLGGKDRWKKRGKQLLKKEVRFLRVDRKLAEQFKSKGLQLTVGDTLAIVIPNGDSLTFILRKHSNGKWLIIAEHWD